MAAVRKLVLEVSGEEFERVRGASPLQRVKSMELLHILRHDKDEFAAVCQVEMDSANAEPERTIEENQNVLEVRTLEQTKKKDGSSLYTVFIKARPQGSSTSALGLVGTGGGYLFSPFGIRDGRLVLTFLGSARQVKTFLTNVEKRGLDHRVVSISDANFSPGSLLGSLTDKQRRAITLAYRLGYYDVPRKINSEHLAEKANLGSSTVVEHLRKAERRLLAQIMAES
jgi:predicted DNA binding protein